MGSIMRPYVASERLLAPFAVSKNFVVYYEDHYGIRINSMKSSFANLQLECSCGQIWFAVKYLRPCIKLKLFYGVATSASTYSLYSPDDSSIAGSWCG